MANLTKQEQIQEWSKLYGRTISDEEFMEICFNLNRFFTTLKEWFDDEERTKLENERTCIIGNRTNAGKV